MTPHLLRLSARYHEVLSRLVRHDCSFVYLTWSRSVLAKPETFLPFFIETAPPMQTPAQTGHGQIWGSSNVPAGSHVQGRHDISPSNVSSLLGIQLLRRRSSLRMARTMDDAGLEGVELGLKCEKVQGQEAAAVESYCDIAEGIGFEDEEEATHRHGTRGMTVAFQVCWLRMWLMHLRLQTHIVAAGSTPFCCTRAKDSLRIIANLCSLGGCCRPVMTENMDTVLGLRCTHLPETIMY